MGVGQLERERLLTFVQNATRTPAWDWSFTVPPPGSRQNGRQDAVGRDGWMFLQGGRGAVLSEDKHTRSSLVEGSSGGTGDYR